MHLLNTAVGYFIKLFNAKYFHLRYRAIIIVTEVKIHTHYNNGIVT